MRRPRVATRGRARGGRVPATAASRNRSRAVRGPVIAACRAARQVPFYIAGGRARRRGRSCSPLDRTATAPAVSRAAAAGQRVVIVVSRAARGARGRDGDRYQLVTSPVTSPIPLTRPHLAGTRVSGASSLPVPSNRPGNRAKECDDHRDAARGWRRRSHRQGHADDHRQPDRAGSTRSRSRTRRSARSSCARSRSTTTTSG